jgi:hypothetical protein
MKSWSLAKIHDFQTSFEFYTILKPFYLTIFIMIREPNARNLAWLYMVLEMSREHEYHVFTNFTI